MLRTLTLQLEKSIHLTGPQISDAVAQLIDETVPPEVKAAFLTALAVKGETPGEIAAFAQQLRRLSIAPELDLETRSAEIIDVCGTGGDRLNTFNISTTVAIVVAAAGVKVAKHGNRAITSMSGSADVLETLGVPIDLTPQQAADSLHQHNFAFFFAQKYHPAFKHIGPARKLCAERGQRTLFNFLGPLLNPVHPTAQLIGVGRPQLCEPLAAVLKTLGIRRAMVVSGKAGESYLDELSTLGENFVAEFYQERGENTSTLHPEDYGFKLATIEDLRGGTKEDNARIVKAILSGEDQGPRLDAVLLNAGAALFLANHSETISDGIDLARVVISSGAATQKLTDLTK
ncbi:MAG: anthranilate phosphoribosyltransferase [Verrucomicrobiota bacterium]|nr:anthranilate phosphoribosyltransferase [Verrucomicrobiota bacterium]